MTPQEFTNKYYKEAQSAAANSGVFPQTILAIAMVESGRGTSLLSSKYNNYFGVKANKNWKGKSVNMKTKEFYNGSNTATTITDYFRVYPNTRASFKDFVNFLKVNNRYKKALTANNYAEQITAIAAAGYATAPNYADIITQVADQINKLMPLIKNLTGDKRTLLTAVIGLSSLLFLYFNSKKNDTQIQN